MKLFFKKLANICLYTFIFLGYFSVLFINIMWPAPIHTKEDLIRRFILALLLSLGIPTIMCGLIWENHFKKENQTPAQD